MNKFRIAITSYRRGHKRLVYPEDDDACNFHLDMLGEVYQSGSALKEGDIAVPHRFTGYTDQNKQDIYEWDMVQRNNEIHIVQPIDNHILPVCNALTTPYDGFDKCVIIGNAFLGFNDPPL